MDRGPGGLQSMGSDTTVQLTSLSFLSLSIMSSRFMSVVACIITSNPLEGWIIFHCVYMPHLVYPFICRWTSGLFAPLAVVNRAAINISESLRFIFTLALTLQSGVLLWGRWKGSGGKGEVIGLYPHLELRPSFQWEGPQRGSPHGNMGNGGSRRWQRGIQQGRLRERKCGRFPTTSLHRERCVGLSVLQMSPLDATGGGDGGPPHIYLVIAFIVHILERYEPKCLQCLFWRMELLVIFTFILDKNRTIFILKKWMPCWLTQIKKISKYSILVLTFKMHCQQSSSTVASSSSV